MQTMKLVMIALTLLLSLSASLSAATSTTTLHIEGMTCAGCETAVKLVLQKHARSHRAAGLLRTETGGRDV